MNENQTNTRIEDFLRNSESIEKFMSVAIDEAENSLPSDVPIGAVIVNVDSEEIVGRGFNQRELNKNSLDHAEIIAIKSACEHIGDWRLNNCVIFSTLEPCVMCAGALSQARIGAIVFGARDEKFGACESRYNFAQDPRLGHTCEVLGDVQAKTIEERLKAFFSEIRK